MQGWADLIIVVAGVVLGVLMFSLGFKFGSSRERPRRGGGGTGKTGKKPTKPRRPRLWLALPLLVALTAPAQATSTDIEAGVTYPDFSIYVQARSYFAIVEYKESALWLVPEVYASANDDTQEVKLSLEALWDMPEYSVFVRAVIDPVTGEVQGKAGARFSFDW